MDDGDIDAFSVMNMKAQQSPDAKRIQKTKGISQRMYVVYLKVVQYVKQRSSSVKGGVVEI